MKVEQPQGFKPITLTLETQADVLLITKLLGATEQRFRNRFGGSDTFAVYCALRDIVGDGYKSHPRVSVSVDGGDIC